ncbi:MAG TPA: twin-arginine translocase TatA/TatE family subunit [Acidobacteriaceae bacterium]|nr:twin-arginine translocase TatA/TatE family subunit [Acidobacteriaceae bacterium]
MRLFLPDCFGGFARRIMDATMPGFGDSAFIVILALLLFGPKKLPVLARQLGKLMADFRRASNEFRSQMEEELRIAEQADRQKEVAALEAANTNKIAPPAEPHTPPEAPNFASPAEGETASVSPAEDTRYPETTSDTDFHGADASFADSATTPETTPPPAPAPIATSGDLTMMPPESGLPIAHSPRSAPEEPQGQLSFGESSNTIPELPSREAELETETLHG